MREIDALGGEMAKNIDATGIQFRVLNTRKGRRCVPVVPSRQALYRLRMKRVLEQQPNLHVKQVSYGAIS